MYFRIEKAEKIHIKTLSYYNNTKFKRKKEELEL